MNAELSDLPSGPATQTARSTEVTNYDISDVEVDAASPHTATNGSKERLPISPHDPSTSRNPTKRSMRKTKMKHSTDHQSSIEDAESDPDSDSKPLIDHTVPLPKNSKKTRRLAKQDQKRQLKASNRILSPLQLPPELFHEILGHLEPSDILCSVVRLNHATRDFVLEHGVSITKEIIGRRYWVLSRCFPLPRLLMEVDEASQQALSHPRREKMTEVHRKPYQHIQAPSSMQLCTCASCLLAWNNLNTVLDLAHFQPSLDEREPIPMIPRGERPKWNTELIAHHAMIVEQALDDPLIYAAVLQKHLKTIISTLLRQLRPPPLQKHQPLHRHNPKTIPSMALPSKQTIPLMIPYDFSPRPDAERQDDRFLERPGKESHEIPWHRDNYYNLVAYIPNRKWSKIEGKWFYYAAGGVGHERDLEWIRRWFLPAV